MDVESTMLPLGTKLPEFNLRGIDEKYHKNSDFSENNGSFSNVYLQSLSLC